VSDQTNILPGIAHPRAAARALLTHYLSLQKSVCLWRLPGQTSWHLVVTERPKAVNDFLVEEAEPGFVMAPFEPGKPAYFFQAEYYFQFKEGEIRQPYRHRELRVEEILGKATPASPAFHLSSSQAALKPERYSYQRLVASAIEKIKQGHFDKVVPSRFKELILPPTFHFLDYFHKLCKQYPDALVTITSSPDTGTWVGASPELLISVDDQQIFRTVAVAGTQARTAALDLKNVQWRQKEIEEQAMVSRYIINCFKKIRLREFDEHGPRTIEAGNLIHLKTEFAVDMHQTNFPQLGSVMLKLLHPTSAVCGMPLEPALKFLKEQEGHDRKFYSGYLGPVNINGATQIFVNLRCMQVCNNKAILYAGAGVTRDSDPQAEWEETELKMQTLSNIILRDAL